MIHINATVNIKHINTVLTFIYSKHRPEPFGNGLVSRRLTLQLLMYSI